MVRRAELADLHKASHVRWPVLGSAKIGRGGFGTAEPMVSATFRDSRRGRGPGAGGRSVTASLMPAVPDIFVIRRAGGRPGVVPGESTAAGHRSRPAGLPREGARTAGWPQGMHARLRRSPQGPGKRGQRGPSVAVRETADGVHRPPQLCTPTVVTVHTDRPCSTDARPLCVRGQRNMTIYSADKVTHAGTEKKRPASARIRSKRAVFAGGGRCWVRTNVG